MEIYDDIRVAAIALDICQEDVEKNLENAERLICDLPKDVDIAVLPELFSTGFVSDADKCKELAEYSDGPTIQKISELAATRNMAVAGSFLAKDSNGLYNRGFFIEPSGDVMFYDKRHLFVLSAEATLVNKGMKPSKVARFRGWNISLAVCYDLRFPVWCRNVGMKYDMLIIPANWPDVRSFAWTHLLQARAIENQAYVIGANRGGSDKYGDYDNQNYVYNFKGESIGEQKGEVVMATLSKRKMEKYRESIPVWKDADVFEIEY